jgi:regulator of sirC expression with transglutaminase-like and TPR domain
MPAIDRAFLEAFVAAAQSPEDNLAAAALMLARLEQPRLDTTPYLAALDAMGRTAQERVASIRGCGPRSSDVEALNAYLFGEQGFEGNRKHYDDPRNSYLSEVLDRRTGIPITLAVVYMEVARRAGIDVHGVNFPGHFLVGCGGRTPLILDPFHGGAVLSEDDCRELLRRHAGDEVAFSPALLAPADKRQILTRMLVNLKRSYVRLRSFPQAQGVTELLVALNPADLSELRDRALLSSHLNELPAALRDLEAYLRLAPASDEGSPDRDELDQLWEHMKALRRRAAALN